jgi:hypothetical protein
MTLTLVDATVRNESRSHAVTRRVREELARVGVSVSLVARKIHTNQACLSRRMTGSVSWDVDLLDEFCSAAGISFDFVTTGIRDLPEANWLVPYDAMRPRRSMTMEHIKRIMPKDDQPPDDRGTLPL